MGAQHPRRRGCRTRLRGEFLRLGAPRLVPLGELPPVFPRWYRWALRYLARTRECLLMDVDGPG
jgi:hypothetical protein